MRAFLLATAFTLISGLSFSQAIISTLSISPSNPSNCENVTATISLVLYCANYTYSGATVSTSGNNVTINLSYSAGLICLPALQYPTLTVNLGQLNSGSVTISAAAYLNSTLSSTSAPFNTTVSSCCGANAAFTLSDDTICVGDTVTTNNQTATADSVKWFDQLVFHDTAFNTSIGYDTAGYHHFRLVAYSDTCNDTVDKHIQVYPLPEVNLGNDTSICDGEILSVSAPNATGYLWSDGSTSQSVTVDTVETVWVEVSSNQGCVNSDTFSVTSILPYSTVTLGPDQTICPDDSTALTPGSGFANYLWSNGSTSSSMNVNAYGLYWVEANQSGECSSRDSIFIDHHTIVPIQFLEDSNKCGTNTISTMVGYTAYQWSTGVISASTTVNDTTMVSLTAIDGNGCPITDSILAVVLEVPAVNLGNDTHVCPGDPLHLTGNVSGASYLWSSGGTGTTLVVTSAGQYWLAVTGDNGCTGMDTIDVDHCVGIEEISNEFKIYPSPATDFITLESSSNLIGTVFIYSVDGSLIRKIQSSDSQLNISVLELESGLYFIETLSSGKTEVLPFMVGK